MKNHVENADDGYKNERHGRRFVVGRLARWSILLLPWLVCSDAQRFSE